MTVIQIKRLNGLSTLSLYTISNCFSIGCIFYLKINFRLSLLSSFVPHLYNNPNWKSKLIQKSIGKSRLKRQILGSISIPTLVGLIWLIFRYFRRKTDDEAKLLPKTSFVVLNLPLFVSISRLIIIRFFFSYPFTRRVRIWIYRPKTIGV
jgi:hypothetical protein